MFNDINIDHNISLFVETCAVNPIQSNKLWIGRIARFKSFFVWKKSE